MMKFGVVTLFAEMFSALDSGITGRAMTNSLVQYQCWNPRDYSENKHKNVDDRPYGGGPGMVATIQPMAAAIEAAKSSLGQQTRVIYLSPQGRKLDQAGVRYLASQQRLILVCGRYEGIDERLLTSHIDEEWSVGDYVLSGGEIAAMIMIDAITRTLPGALGDEQSSLEDSFENGLLDYPHYTRPENYQGQAVPKVLLSGDHKAIARWRLQQSLGRTWLKRPDLLANIDLTAEQQQLLNEFIEHSERSAR